VESHNDSTEMNTSTMMAYHNGAWTCTTPFYMEDWTYHNMYMQYSIKYGTFYKILSFIKAVSFLSLFLQS
jgi:hypothetical protein